MFQESSKNFTIKDSEVSKNKDIEKIPFFFIISLLIVLAIIMTFYRVYISNNIKYFINEEEVADFNPFDIHGYY